MKTRSKFTLSGFIALLTCPCHVPIYAFLLSGTTIGGLMADYSLTLILIFALVFLFAIGIAAKSYKIQQLELQKKLHKERHVN